jgi:hypothetical protein
VTLPDGTNGSIAADATTAGTARVETASTIAGGPLQRRCQAQRIDIVSEPPLGRLSHTTTEDLKRPTYGTSRSKWRLGG